MTASQFAVGSIILLCYIVLLLWLQKGEEKRRIEHKFSCRSRGCVCVSDRDVLSNLQSIAEPLRTLTACLLSAAIDHAGYLQQILNCQHAAIFFFCYFSRFSEEKAAALHDSSDILTWRRLILHLTAKATIGASENCPFLKVRLKFALRLFNLRSPVREEL